MQHDNFETRRTNKFIIKIIKYSLELLDDHYAKLVYNNNRMILYIRGNTCCIRFWVPWCEFCKQRRMWLTIIVLAMVVLPTLIPNKLREKKKFIHIYKEKL
jgi:hypothetical protein